MTSQVLPIDVYCQQIGREIGLTRWFTIDQDRINTFATTTEDEQFIHIDPERARATQYGSTIAHGFLTLSMLSAMSFDALPALAGERIAINYGFNKVRFIAPVHVDKRIRGRFTLQELIEREPDQWQRTVKVAIEIEAEEKPALIAEWISVSIL